MSFKGAKVVQLPKLIAEIERRTTKFQSPDSQRIFQKAIQKLKGRSKGQRSFEGQKLIVKIECVPVENF